MSAGKRLGKDPLSRPATPGSGGGQAFMNILDMPAPAPQAAPQADPESVYKDVAARFSEAMEHLSRMAAASGAGVWGAQCGQSGSGDTLPFMRLMAAYRVLPDGEGVDVQAFLSDGHDKFAGCDLVLKAGLPGVLISLPRAFALARGLQAALECFVRPRADGASLLTLEASLTPRGSLKTRLFGCREHFPRDDKPFSSDGGAVLAELARSGEASVLFTCSEETAELALLV